MVLTQSRYKQDLQQMISAVQQKSFHPYVQQHISYPQVNLLQLHLSYLYLTFVQVAEQKRKNIVMSQMFIQLGLDTHEEVPVTDRPMTIEDTVTQLSVLAGDYFSSHYYLYLAEQNELELIVKWADVIQQVNEKKMDLHVSKAKWTDEEYFERWCEVQAMYSVSVLHWYGADEQWHRMTRLLTQLVEGVQRWQQHPQPFERLMAEVEETILGFPAEWRDELQLWVEEARHQQFVI